MQKLTHTLRRGTVAAVVAALAVLAATLSLAPGVEARSNAEMVGWVEYGGKGVPNIWVDLFYHARADGSGHPDRGDYIKSVKTVATGGLYFSAPEGCYVMTFIAPKGSTFSNGTRYENRSTCVKAGEWDTGNDAVLKTYSGSGSATAKVASAPQPTTTTVAAPATTARPATTVRQATTTTAKPTTTVRQTTTTAKPTTTAPPSNSGSCASGSTFETVYRNDFNGNSIDSAWHLYNSAGNGGNGLRRPSAVTVADGKLIITAANNSSGTVVTGGMSHNLDQTYGRFSFKVRTDNDASRSTSGVVLTWPKSGVHPRDGENNMYETSWTEPTNNPFHSYIHKPYGSKSDQEAFTYNADGAQWQIMTMEWTPSKLTLTREGPGNTWTETRTVTETGSDLIPDVPHHMSIQLDTWRQSIGSPVKMELDWVEIGKYCG